MESRILVSFGRSAAMSRCGPLVDDTAPLAAL